MTQRDSRVQENSEGLYCPTLQLAVQGSWILACRFKNQAICLSWAGWFSPPSSTSRVSAWYGIVRLISLISINNSQVLLVTAGGERFITTRYQCAIRQWPGILKLKDHNKKPAVPPSAAMFSHLPMSTAITIDCNNWTCIKFLLWTELLILFLYGK